MKMKSEKLQEFLRKRMKKTMKIKKNLSTEINNGGCELARQIQNQKRRKILQVNVS